MNDNEQVATLPPPPAPPAPAAPAPSGPSLTELVAGMLQDATKLFGQHIDMLKAEFHEDLQRTKDAGVFAGLGIVLTTIGGMTLVAASVLLLIWLFPEWPVWVACAVIGAGFVVAGLACGYTGKTMFESFNPLPDKTFNALQENLSWISKAQK